MPLPKKDHTLANRIAQSSPGDSVVFLIHQDTPCPGCGYNLIGLRFGQPCPECGRITARESRRDGLNENLVSAPISYLRFLQLGMLMMALCSIAILFLALSATITFGAAAVSSVMPSILGKLNLASQFGYAASGVPLFYRIAPWVLSACAFLWFGGLLIVSRPRPKYTDSMADNPRDPWRTHALISLACESMWLPAALAWMWLVAQASIPAAPPAPGAAPVAPAANLFTQIIGVAFYAFIAIGALGLLPTALFLSRFADWACDTSLASRFRVAVGGIVIFGVFLALGAGFQQFHLFAAIFSFAWTASVILLLLSVMSIAVMCSHAVVNANQALARDQRMVAKMQEEAARQRAIMEAAPIIEPPDLTHRVGTPRRK